MLNDIVYILRIEMNNNHILYIQRIYHTSFKTINNYIPHLNIMITNTTIKNRSSIVDSFSTLN